ncbi:MAG: SGNH/GDSL hydrolase family protein [Myxococcales bacterium]|nr:SGNH/GDSL hydrolase family protein [Myxococcales bacterium]
MRHGQKKGRIRRRLGALGLVFGLGLGGPAADAGAQEPAPGEAAGEGEAAAPEPANWAFRDASRPVKVIVLAGSIGAWPRQPYAERLGEMCRNVEVKNLSKTGFGALQLKQRFRQQVLDNRRVPLGRGDDTSEYWLVFQGGLNSVGMPESTNNHMRELFALAHARGLGVVAFSLTPWGDESDRRRWSGVAGLVYLRYTRKIVDFVLSRLEPADALGDLARKRKAGAEAPWEPEELPDVGVDLYSAPYLRDAEAPLRDEAALRRELERDPTWKRRLKDVDEAERTARLDAEAAAAAEIPRWFLRAELRSFDHIHPNVEGHRRIAELACPHLPASWGCACPELPAGAAAAPAVEEEPRSAVEQVLLPFYPRWVRDFLHLLGEPG